MPKLVIDTNIVLTWLGLQNASLLERADKLFRDAARNKLQLVAPEFLAIEIINILKWRLKRNYQEANEVLQTVLMAGIALVPVGVESGMEINKLVHEHSLSAYDALYLSVAQNLNCALVTEDEKLLAVTEWTTSLSNLSRN